MIVRDLSSRKRGLESFPRRPMSRRQRVDSSECHCPLDLCRKEEGCSSSSSSSSNTRERPAAITTTTTTTMPMPRTKRGTNFISSTLVSMEWNKWNNNPIKFRNALFFPPVFLLMMIICGCCCRCCFGSFKKLFFFLQRWILSTITSSVLISALQALVALLQYRINPAGQLIIPPGPTIGVQYPSDHSLFDSSSSSSSSSPPTPPKNNHPIHPSASFHWIKRINRFLALLFPWLIQNFHHTYQEWVPLADIATILTGVRFLNFGRRKKARSLLFNPPSQPVTRILVLGDSLAVGVGTVEQFQIRTPPDDGLEYRKIENAIAAGNITTTPSSFSPEPGPVFPSRLARILAERQNSPVLWRSAGVDGGTVYHIRNLLLSVLEEEIRQGRLPDCIVLLCGMNDLKLQFANNLFQKPWRALSASGFRRELHQLIQEIQKLCDDHNNNNNTPTFLDGEISISPRHSNTTIPILLPAMPTQMILTKNSVVGILPLSILLDMAVGYWESQKERIAKEYPNVLYLPLSTQVVKQWYQRSQDGLFVSADGIHPNAQCYSFWAEHVAHSLFCPFPHLDNYK